MSQTVDSSIICAWLGIPPNQWPPDHYTLLGISRTEADVATIERLVQLRLEQVRRYQLCHPDAATEAMNRIAQAFVCLSDTQARQAYDRAVFGDLPPPAPVIGPSTPTPLPTMIDAPALGGLEVDPAFLKLVEDEVRAAETAQESVVQTASAPVVTVESLPTVDAPVAPETKKPGPVPRHLATKRAIYQQIVHTRTLLHLWQRAGRYLGPGKKRLSRPSEARDLIEALTAIRKGLPELPNLLGEAGQPGYLVVALARQPAIVPTFQTLRGSQREALARDWEAGQTALQQHQRFLREETRTLKRQTPMQRLMRAGRSFLNEHPAGWLIAGGVTALAIVLIRRLFMN